MSHELATDASTFAATRRVVTKTIGGHEFTITEPGGLTAGRAVALFVPLIGNRAEMDEKVKGLSAVFLSDDLDEPEKQTQAFEIIFKDEAEIEALDGAGIVELLALVTDRDAEWYDKDELSFDDLMQLLQEVAAVLPFGPVFAQRGRASMAFVSSLTAHLADSVPSSPENAGGGGQTSADAGLNSLRVSGKTSKSTDEPH